MATDIEFRFLTAKTEQDIKRKLEQRPSGSRVLDEKYGQDEDEWWAVQVYRPSREPN